MNPATSPRLRRRPAWGFTLVEITLALGIAVFCLVVVFGLLTVGVNTSSYSSEQTVAATLLPAVAADLRGAPNPFPKGSAQRTAIYGIQLPAALPAPSSGAPPAASPTPSPAPPGLPVPVYLGANGQVIPALKGSNGEATFARYQLNVWTTPGVGRGATMARVSIAWPAGVQLANAAGSVETLVALDRN